MSVFTSFWIDLAVNLDNFLIGMNFGIQNRRLSPAANLFLSLTSGFFAFIPAALSKWLFSSFSDIAETVGAGLMIFYGLCCLKHACDPAPDSPALPDAVPFLQAFRQFFFLGVLLAVNCIPPAISAGAFLLSPPAIGFFCFLFSFLSLGLGNLLGRRLPGCPLSRVLPHLSALLLILIGYVQFWLG